MTAAEPKIALPSWRRANDGPIGGNGVDPAIIANSIIERSLDDFIDINPLQLQRLMYFTACLYMRGSGLRLLSEQFQAWETGPVLASVHSRLSALQDRPIREYMRGANGLRQRVKDRPGDNFRRALNLVWDNLAGFSAADLSRIIKVEGSAWYKAWASNSLYINDSDMADDTTFFASLGLETV